MPESVQVEKTTENMKAPVVLSYVPIEQSGNYLQIHPNIAL